jgi:hypothetical protein
MKATRGLDAFAGSDMSRDKHSFVVLANFKGN